MASEKPWIRNLLQFALNSFITRDVESSQFSFDHDPSSKILGIKAHLDEPRALTIVNVDSENSGSDGNYALPLIGNDGKSLQKCQLLSTSEIDFLVHDHFDLVRAEIYAHSLKVDNNIALADRLQHSPMTVRKDSFMQNLLKKALYLDDCGDEEVRSQIESPSRSREEVFQTQVVAPSTMPDAPKATEGRRIENVSTSEQRQNNAALSLLKPKHGGQPLLSSKTNDNSAEMQPDLPPVVHSAEESTINELLPSSSAISQQPLNCPPSSPPAAPTAPAAVIEKPVPAKSQIEPVLPPLDAQHWSKRYGGHRYLPRRISRISKPQLDILKSDNSYHPPLPGRDFRPGTVPLGLLQKIIAQADELALAAEVPDLQDGGIRSPDKEQLEEEEKEEGDDDSKSVDSEAWPASSPPQRMGLPPDSSSVASSPAKSQVHHSSDVQAASPLPGKEKTTRSQCTSTTLSEVEAQTSTQSQLEQTAQKTNSVRPDLAVTALAHEQISKVSPTVQIKRTPQLLKACPPSNASELSQGPPQGSSGSSSEIIDSTFKSVEKGPVLPDQVPIEAASDPEAAENVATMNATRTRKHPAPDVTQEMREAKRSRIISKGRGPDTVDAAYDQVVEANRARRIAELTALKARKQDGQRTSSPSAVSDVSHPPKMSIAAKSGASLLRRSSHSSHSNVNAELVTPITVTSRGFNRLPEPPRASPKLLVPEALFKQFQSEYPDYDGKIVNFQNSFSLLRRLRQEGKGPHPYLFDDFIFHHYHSYPSYMDKVKFSDEDPLPYDRFYDMYIESPEHMQKVLTLRSLALQFPQLEVEVPVRERDFAQKEEESIPQSTSLGVSAKGHTSPEGKRASPPHTWPQAAVPDTETRQLTDVVMPQKDANVVMLQKDANVDMDVDVNMDDSEQDSDEEEEEEEEEEKEALVKQTRQPSPELGSNRIGRYREDNVRPHRGLARNAERAASESITKTGTTKIATLKTAIAAIAGTTTSAKTTLYHGVCVSSPARRVPVVSIASTPSQLPSQPSQANRVKSASYGQGGQPSTPKNMMWALLNKPESSDFRGALAQSDPGRGSSGRESLPDYYKWRQRSASVLR